MKWKPLVLIWLILAAICLFSQSWAQCPEEPNDNGLCDTLYIEIWPGDEFVPFAFPHYARFPIRVTNDIPDPNVDSIAGIVTPLSFTSSNSSANVRIEAARNTTDLYPFPDLDNSIFRHLPDMAHAQERNFMMDYAEQMIGLEWDTRILDIGGGTHFWLSIVPTGTPDRRFPGGSRVLTATVTFTMEDTTTICMDSCFWPPTGFLAFSRADAVTYFPRHFLPVCQEVSFPCWWEPDFTVEIEDQSHDCSGHYVTDEFLAEDPVCGPITQAGCSFEGDGVDNVVISDLHLDWYEAWGHVEYDVTNACASGGWVSYWVRNMHGGMAMGVFQIDLTNDPPELSLSDTWRALVGYTMGMQVSASDPNENPVTIELEGFWYQADSLQPPVTPPSWDGGNPGLLTWVPTEADTGNWVCAFSAYDGCGCGDAEQVVIHVHEPFCGDCGGDEFIDLADVVYLITYLYRQGPAPEPECRGDTNCDGLVDVGDVVLLVSYLFKFGSAPCAGCCAGG